MRGEEGGRVGKGEIKVGGGVGGRKKSGVGMGESGVGKRYRKVGGGGGREEKEWGGGAMGERERVG